MKKTTKTLKKRKNKAKSKEMIPCFFDSRNRINFGSILSMFFKKKFRYLLSKKQHSDIINIKKQEEIP